MLIRLFLWLSSLSATFQEKLWKWWYQKLSSSYQKKDWTFMNYGYVPSNKEPLLILRPEDEENRLFIQLYEHVLAGLDLKGKKVLEVGSGKGGGADYVARYLNPVSMVGVDFAKNAVNLCNQFYQVPSLSFIEASAEKLPFEPNSFDVVLNVESSHCYGNMEAFLEEVTRVLKPGGVFAWADLRTFEKMEQESLLFENFSLKILHKEEITLNVLRALEQISNRKKEKIQKCVPSFLQSLFFEFTGVCDSKMYRGFQEGKMVYFCYHFQKEKGSL